MKKVMADTISGVFQVSSFDDFKGCVILDQDAFYASLKDLSDNEIIGAEIDKSMSDKIDAEYGIH